MSLTNLPTRNLPQNLPTPTAPAQLKQPAPVIRAIKNFQKFPAFLACLIILLSGPIIFLETLDLSDQRYYKYISAC
jgi:hypothetical protein